MTFKDKTTQKFISSVIIISMFLPALVLFSKPQKAEATFAGFIADLFAPFIGASTATSATGETTQVAFSYKKLATDILKEVAKGLARKALARMTQSTINWINSDFHGRPLFVENPKSFFKDIAKSEVKGFVDEIGYNSLGYPFGKKMALNTISSFKSKFADNAQYSLSKVINDPLLLDRYRNDFNYGGWNGFLINTQYPQNNYVGFQMLATDELARRLEGTQMNAAKKVQKTLDQGMGFLSKQSCPSNPNYNLKTDPYNRPAYKPPPYKPQVQDPEDIRREAEYRRIWERQNASRRAQWEQLSPSSRPPYEPVPYNPPPKVSGLIEINYNKTWEIQDAVARADWAKTNVCTGGLVTNTPGSVVAASLNKVLGGSHDMTLAGVNYGNSLSAIFDTLINHYMGKGLSALASKVNPPPLQDDWSYQGQTLGSPPNSGTGSDWTSGPDEEIVLDDFKKKISGQTMIEITEKDATTDTDVTTKKSFVGNLTDIIKYPKITGETDVTKREYVPGDIVNTATEVALMDETFQIMSQIWPEVLKLDKCQPGPDLNWEDRTRKEMERNSQKLQGKLNDSDGEKSAAAQQVFDSLKFAVDYFKDWVKTKMMSALPNSIIYMDAVKEIETLDQQAKELTDKKRNKAQTLARLKAIEINLDQLTDKPVAGSPEEKKMVAIRKQYNAIKSSISNSLSIEDIKSELDTAKDKLNNLKKLVTECGVERTKAGWTNPGGRDSSFNPSGVAAADNLFKSPGTEQALFCDAPIKGGYDHNSFLHKNDGGHGALGGVIGLVVGGPVGAVIGNRIGGATGTGGAVTHPDIPYVNAQKVFSERRKVTLGLKTHNVNIKMGCSFIYRAYILTYKGNIPGTTNLVEPKPDPIEDVYVEPNENDPPDEGTPDTPPATSGGGGRGVCATPAEISKFLAANPGDEARLSSAFPCP